MKSLIDVGREILSGNPTKLYVLTGQEYGIKAKYIDILRNYYSGRYKSYDSAKDVFDLFRVKRIIPLEPCLYVVRYDSDFLRGLNESLAANIRSLKILGTVVLIYQDKRDCTKVEKYLSDYTTSIDGVSIEHMMKYIYQDHPEIPENVCKNICEISSDYGEARSISECISLLPTNEANSLSKKDLMALCGKSLSSKSSEVKRAIAEKNFKQLINLLDTYTDELHMIYYDILSTMTDLDKLKSNVRVNCEASPYVKNWSIEDIYYMFVHTYNELVRSRSVSVNITNSILYLFSLLRFDHIPTTEELSSD